ncbi:tetraspanin-3-like [Falco naumanni]|uniref:tetraspanin-3-like n=1 Tax=Falco naumanni TaxID=148594 RepID=UPI001ADE1185|nr:tetraspanin-3-like [Falco naumanni]
MSLGFGLLGLSRMRRIRTVVVFVLSLLSLWCYEDSRLRPRPVAQFLLRFLGFIFWGAAAAMACAGVFVILIYKNCRYLFQESFLLLPGWLAVAAALILVPTGVLAVSISVKTSRCQQGILMYLLVILFWLELSLVVLTQMYSVQMASELKSTMGYLVYHYNGTHSQGPGSTAVDMVQRELQCCGIQNCTDWLKTAAASVHLSGVKSGVTESCCKEKYSHCMGDLNHLEQLFQEGCLKKLEGQLRFVMLCMFWCCTVLSVLGMLAGVSNGILMRHQLLYDLQILDSATFS